MVFLALALGSCMVVVIIFCYSSDMTAGLSSLTTGIIMLLSSLAANTSNTEDTAVEDEDDDEDWNRPRSSFEDEEEDPRPRKEEPTGECPPPLGPPLTLPVPPPPKQLPVNEDADREGWWGLIISMRW